MRFKPIPADYFERFHNKFKGDNPKIFEACRRCGGACEYNKIGTLLPGEEEYMSQKMSVPINAFENRFLDIVKMEDGTELYVLKFVNGCPFLNKSTYECMCRRFKVILCEIYPIIFRITKKGTKYLIDSNCPLYDIPELRKYFEEVGIPAFAEIPMPKRWLNIVAKYDHLNIDYKAIERKRKDLHSCEIWPFDLVAQYLWAKE